MKKKRPKKELKINKNPPKSPFCRNIFEKEYFIKNSVFLKKKRRKNELKINKIPQIAILWDTFSKKNIQLKFLCLKKIAKKQKNNNFSHNCLQYERMLKILYFHILKLPNLAKYTYWLSQLEQHSKIVGRKKSMQNLLNIEQFCERKFNKIKTKYFRKIRESSCYYWKAKAMSEIS